MSTLLLEKLTSDTVTLSQLSLAGLAEEWGCIGLQVQVHGQLHEQLQ